MGLKQNSTQNVDSVHFSQPNISEGVLFNFDSTFPISGQVVKKRPSEFWYIVY